MLFFVCKTSGKLTRAFTPLLFRYGATASKLSNMTFAPHLVRMLPPDTWSVNSLVKIMHSYGWKRAFVAFDGSDPWAVGYKNGVADSAQQMGITEGAVKVSVFRLRRRFGELLLAEVRQTLGPDTDPMEEIRALQAALRGSGSSSIRA